MTDGKTARSMQHHKCRAGTLSIELFVAMAIMTALFGLLATFGSTLKKVDDYHWTQYRLAAAGQAQMDAIAATGKPIEAADFSRLWPGVACNVTVSDGTGPWAGLRQVRLDLSANSRQKIVRVELIRYIPNDKEPVDDR